MSDHRVICIFIWFASIFFSQTSIIYQDQESMVFLLLCPSNNVVLHMHGKIRTKTESGGGSNLESPCPDRPGSHSPLFVLSPLLTCCHRTRTATVGAGAAPPDKCSCGQDTGLHAKSNREGVQWIWGDWFFPPAVIKWQLWELHGEHARLHTLLGSTCTPHSSKWATEEDNATAIWVFGGEYKDNSLLGKLPDRLI